MVDVRMRRRASTIWLGTGRVALVLFFIGFVWLILLSNSASDYITLGISILLVIIVSLVATISIGLGFWLRLCEPSAAPAKRRGSRANAKLQWRHSDVILQ